MTTVTLPREVVEYLALYFESNGESSDEIGTAKTLRAALDAPPDAVSKFVASQEPLGSEFSKVLHDNLDSLYESTPAISQPDCRGCRNYHIEPSGEYCVKAECIDGDKFRAMVPIRLYKVTK